MAAKAVAKTLKEEVVVAAREVRSAIGHLVAALPGRVESATQLQRALGVDYNLCWHLNAILKAEDPVAAARHIPSTNALRRLAAAAEGAGVSERVVEGLRTSFVSFDRVVKEHAADRNTFKTMVANMTGEDAAEGMVLQHRRNIYRSEVQVWGSQVKLHLQQSSVRRRGENQVEAIGVGVKLGFQRLRASAKPVVTGARMRDRHGAPLARLPQQPIDAEAAKKYGAHLLGKFCSQPIPKLGSAQTADGWTYYLLEAETFGRRGAMDIAVAVRNDGGTLTALRDGRKIFYITMMCTAPTETAVIELCVHRGSFGEVSPRLSMMPPVGVDQLAEILDPEPQLAVFERVEVLGSLEGVVPVSGVKRYGEMMEYVYGEVGWEMGEFDVYRATVTCPLMNTAVMMWFEVD